MMQVVGLSPLLLLYYCQFLLWGDLGSCGPETEVQSISNVLSLEAPAIVSLSWPRHCLRSPLPLRANHYPLPLPPPPLLRSHTTE